MAASASPQLVRLSSGNVLPGSDATIQPLVAAIATPLFSMTCVPRGAAAGGRAPRRPEPDPSPRTETSTTVPAASTTTSRIAIQATDRRYQGVIGRPRVAAGGRARGPTCGLGGGDPGRYRLAGAGTTPPTRGDDSWVV